MHYWTKLQIRSAVLIIVFVFISLISCFGETTARNDKTESTQQQINYSLSDSRNYDKGGDTQTTEKLDDQRAAYMDMVNGAETD